MEFEPLSEEEIDELLKIDDPEVLNWNSPFPHPKVIAIDVDDTLIVNGKLNDNLCVWCKKQQKAGFYLILWSAQGKRHAEKAQKLSGIKFDCVISKPGHIVDDLGWKWTKYTQEIYP